AGSVGGFLLAVVLMSVFRRRPAAASVAIAVLLLCSGALAHEGEDHGPAPPAPGSNVPQRLPDGSLFVPKATQPTLAIRTMLTDAVRYARTVELPGRIIPDPNASGLVQAAAGGRLSAPPGGFPRLGTRVSAGDVLAYVTAPVQTIDVSDMR